MLVYSQNRSFYGDLHEMSDILIMLLIHVCVELDKIPLLHKLKQLYERLPLGFFFLSILHILLITHCTSCIPRWQFIFRIQNCDHMMKTLYRPSSVLQTTQSGMKECTMPKRGMLISSVGPIETWSRVKTSSCANGFLSLKMAVHATQLSSDGLRSGRYNFCYTSLAHSK